MDKLPPAVNEFFEQERKKQATHNTVAIIHGNLRDTKQTMHKLLVGVVERAEVLDDTEERANELVSSSEYFYHMTMPGWKKYLYSWRPPAWWFSRMNLCVAAFIIALVILFYSLI
jgi:hypothetical protein